MTYFSSRPGRCVLAATALFILGPGLAGYFAESNAWLSVRLMAILPMLACGFSIAGVGLGMFSWPRQTLIFIINMPVLMWLIYPAFNQIAVYGKPMPMLVCALGAIILIWSCVPSKDAKPGQFTQAT